MSEDETALATVDDNIEKESVDGVDPETIIRMHLDGRPPRKYIPVDGVELQDMLAKERDKEKQSIIDWLRWFKGASRNPVIKDALNQMLSSGKSTLECVCNAIENNTHHKPRP